MNTAVESGATVGHDETVVAGRIVRFRFKKGYKP
jgi:hypothetical protein